MTSKEFRKKLVKAIEKSKEFATDTIEMEDLIKSARRSGFDEFILVAGKDENEVFTLSIQKII